MKKAAIILGLCIVSLSAFSFGEMKVFSRDGKQTSEIVSNAPTANIKTVDEVKAYFPFEKDIHMQYKGIGNEYAEYETYVDYIKDNTMQIRRINGGTTSVVVYRCKDGVLKKSYMRGETYYRYNYTSFVKEEEILLKAPIKTGNSWTLKNGDVRSITAVDMRLKMPAGEYKAIEVTTENKDSTIKDYYVKGIGHVKSEYKAKNDSFTVASELKKIDKGTPFKHSVRFYFPDPKKGKIVYMDREVGLLTNEDMLYRFQKELKTIPSKSTLVKGLSKGTKILGYSINEEKGILTVDFSSNLTKEMSKYAKTEDMILKSIVNTFGSYYQVDKVIIKVNGKPYKSANVSMKEGQYFTVNLNNIKEYNK